MLKKFSFMMAVFFMMAFVLPSHVLADSPIYTSAFSNKAVKGYDTVSYFQGDGMPVKGKKEFKTEWRGADWYFASKENLDLFLANPTKYAPQYGGYCAWAVAHETLAKGDPKVYEIVDGKLYLNYNKSLHGKWSPRKGELIEQGNELYPELVTLN